MRAKINYFDHVSLLIVAFFMAFALNDIARPPIDLHQYRQTQTLSTIYNFWVDGINLLSPELNTNGSKSFVILEFPLFQAVSAALMKIFGFNEIIPRLLNIGFTVFTGLLTSTILQRWIIPGSFNLGLAIFLLTPSSIYWSSIPIIDPLALALSVFSVYCIFVWLETKQLIGFVLAVALASLALMVKLTAAVIPFLFAFIFLISAWVNKTLSRKEVSFLLVGFVIACIVFLLWILYSKNINSSNPHPYTNGSVSWYLGTNEQRTDPVVWRHFLSRIIWNHLGVLIELAFASSAIYLFYCFFLLTSSFVYLLIFINLNFMHTYYQIPLNFAYALIGGIGGSLLVGRFERKQSIAQIILVLIMMASSHYVLKNKWIDLAPITSPYEKSSCEYELGNQVRNQLANMGVKHRLIGVALERNSKCWNGPHAIMYYLHGRGYVSHELSDPIFEKEHLDLVLGLSRDFVPEQKTGWTLLFRKKMNGLVNDYYLNIYQKRVSGERQLFIPGNVIINGSNVEVFNHGITLTGLPIPPYSDVLVSYEIDKATSSAAPYFLARTFTGGYSHDVYREIIPGRGLVNINFQTNGYDDYVMYFGQLNKGSYGVAGDIRVKFKSLFVAVHD